MMLKKPTKNARPGPAQATGYKPRAMDLSPDILQKLYFSTSSSRASPDHFAVNAEDAKSARPASMKSISQPNLKWEASTAPSANRSNTTNAAEYNRKPLDAAPITRELGMLLAGDAYRGQGNSNTRGQHLSSETTTKSCYLGKQSGGGVVQPFKPETNTQIDPRAKFLESKTAFQRQFQEYDEEAVKRSRGKIVIPANSAGSPSGGDAAIRAPNYTTYERDYIRTKTGQRSAGRVPALHKH